MNLLVNITIESRWLIKKRTDDLLEFPQKYEYWDFLKKYFFIINIFQLIFLYFYTLLFVEFIKVLFS